LVTGADGFIGSHLVETLLARGHQVTALAQYNSFNNWGWLQDIGGLDQFQVITGDIRDPHFCKQITQGQDVIFHLAALIAIPYSYVAPDSYIDVNVRGTLNICQAARENGVGRILHTSTSEVYGTAQYVPIDEAHPLQPQSPYSASKIGADAIAMSFFHAFGLPVTIARPFNTYGPRQSARAVIPTIISQIAAGKKQIALGDLSPTRDFSFVRDTCRGLVLLAECEAAVGKTVNIGSNSEISIGDTLEAIKRVMGADVEIVSESQRIRPENSEVQRLWCDNSLIHGMTGYKPEYSLEAGLRETVAWFRDPANISKYKPDIYNV
jgi:NAD dependent epimerase/dehydratase